MAIVVVGGGGRGAGKTTLVCGVISALPEFNWVAAKITTHAHGLPQAIYRDENLDSETDTARYLAAGARQAFLLTLPEEDESGPLLYQEWMKRFPGANIILESNQVLNFAKLDLCLVVAGNAQNKASCGLALQHANAIVLAPNSDDLKDTFTRERRPIFELESIDKLPPELVDWIRGRLIYR